MALSDAKIRAAKPGATIQKLSDGAGLQLWVTPAGGKHWKLAYRFQVGSKPKPSQLVLPLGAYPAVGLADARQAALAARALLARGVDPSAQKKTDKLVKASADAITFEYIAKKVIEEKRNGGKSETTIGKVRWLFDLAKPHIGEFAIASITPQQVLTALKAVADKGQLETARRLRAVIGQAFRYAIANLLATTDPTSALRDSLTAPKVKSRTAILEPKAFGGLLRAIDGFPGQPTTRACLQLMAILYPRPGELRQAEWSEFDFEKAVWTIDARRTKMRREHRVPLPRQAVEILEGLRLITGDSNFVFPGLRPALRPLSENTLNGALRRLGFGPDEMTSYGFRASASTMLNESGLWNSDAIERALAHQDADPVRRAYARSPYWEERVRMGQWWADRLDELRGA